MAIEYVGAAVANADTVTMPSHQSGDLILAMGYRHNNNSAPTLPSGWLGGETQTGATNGVVYGWKIATSSSETSGTWTNATQLAVAVYRSNASRQVTRGTLSSTSAIANVNITYNANAGITNGTYEAWMVAMVGTRTDEHAHTAPTGMTNRASTVSTGEIAIHDSNGTDHAWPTTTVTGNAVTYRSAVFEVIEVPYTMSASSGGVPLIGHGGLVY
jgi:hypothetical protein